MKKFFSWFFGSKNKKAEHQSSARRHISDVKPGQNIFLQYNRITGVNNIGNMYCISNDTESKQILLQVFWNNGNNEKLIFNYSDDAFKNFHLLNS